MKKLNMKRWDILHCFHGHINLPSTNNSINWWPQTISLLINCPTSEAPLPWFLHQIFTFMQTLDLRQPKNFGRKLSDRRPVLKIGQKSGVDYQPRKIIRCLTTAIFHFQRINLSCFWGLSCALLWNWRSHQVILSVCVCVCVQLALIMFFPWFWLCVFPPFLHLACFGGAKGGGQDNPGRKQPDSSSFCSSPVPRGVLGSPDSPRRAHLDIAGLDDFSSECLSSDFQERTCSVSVRFHCRGQIKIWFDPVSVHVPLV